MAYLASDFKTAFPVFASAVTDADVTRHIARAVNYVDVSRYGVWYNDALGYLTAHFIAMESKDQAMGIQGRAGDITYKSASSASGEARLERAAPAVMLEMTDPFMRTQYGQRFRDIARVAALGGGAAGADSC